MQIIGEGAHNPFGKLQELRQPLLPAPWETDRFGVASLVPGSTQVIETPASVTDAGKILTNPSIPIDTTLSDYPVTIIYAREERATHHLGTTWARPYVIYSTLLGKIKVTEADLPPIEGEDLRISRIWLPTHLGSRPGWLASVVEAKPLNEEHTQHEAQQVFYCGESLENLKRIAKGPVNAKDACVCAADGVALHLVGRRQEGAFSGNLTYARLKDVTELTEERIAEASIIDPRLAPFGSGYWIGSNNLEVTGDGSILIQGHDACRSVAPDGRTVLHYWLARYGLDPSTRRICALGQYAASSQFPPVRVKTSPDRVHDDIVYGAYARVKNIFPQNPEPIDLLLAGKADSAMVAARVSTSR